MMPNDVKLSESTASVDVIFLQTSSIQLATKGMDGKALFYPPNDMIGGHNAVVSTGKRICPTSDQFTISGLPSSVGLVPDFKKFESPVRCVAIEL